jgi:peroxin-12
LIPPSIRYLLVLATQRHPRYLLRILNSYDELYALVMVVVERHYLRNYGGGFTENFYGLKRERVLRVDGGELLRTQVAAPGQIREALKLRTSDVWKNVAIMVGLPYLKRKLDESYEIHAPQAALLGPNYNRDTLPADATVKQRVIYHYKWFLRNVYPSVNAAYYFSLLAFNIAYLFSNTAYSSPLLWLVQTRIRRMGEADHAAIAAVTKRAATPGAAPVRPGQTNSMFGPRTMVSSVGPRLLSGLRMVLPTSIFALKFLEWWHASDFARQLSRKAAESVDLPPPIISGLPRNVPTSTAPPENTVSLGKTAGGAPPRAPSISPPPPLRLTPPISSSTGLPILTVPAPRASTSKLCPICLKPIITATAAQTGFVFCYTCIFRWVEGTHDRQMSWMEGGGAEAGWGEGDSAQEQKSDGGQASSPNRSRIGRWESGKGRCAVTGRKVLGGTEGLRRVMV